jgi:hypothetical protein
LIVDRWPVVPRGEYEWDQADDPWMINKTIVPVTNHMTGNVCSEEHYDGWGDVHLCERAHGHTGRHFATERLGRYIVAVWK